MGTSADQIRHEIEQTRNHLGSTIDEVTDRTSPGRIADRGKQRVRQRLTNTRDKVMGTKDKVMGSKDKVMDTAESGLQRAEEQTRGNPLAAGLIAFGGGMLAATLMPTTQKEQQAAQALSEHAQPVLDQAKQVGADLGGSLKETARDAAQNVQEKAKEAAQHVKEDATSSAETVRDHAQESAQTVRHDARRQM